jgi:hypothetical protein
MVVVCSLLAGWPNLAWADDGPCGGLPAGSLSRTECERQKAARIRQEEELKRRKQEAELGTVLRGTTIHDFMCRSTSPSGVTFVSGLPGDAVHGRFLNTLDKKAHGLGVSFEFLDHQSTVVGKVIAPVFPDTLGPSEVGEFHANLPHRNQLSRPWDCLRVTVVEQDAKQIEMR